MGHGWRQRKLAQYILSVYAGFTSLWDQMPVIKQQICSHWPLCATGVPWVFRFILPWGLFVMRVMITHHWHGNLSVENRSEHPFVKGHVTVSCQHNVHKCIYILHLWRKCNFGQTFRCSIIKRNIYGMESSVHIAPSTSQLLTLHIFHVMSELLSRHTAVSGWTWKCPLKFL